MKYCCEYVYRCPARSAVSCYVHDGPDPCCADEQAHKCVRDMYGTEDDLMYGDGFTCLRCGNYELVGHEHQAATEPGFPRRRGPARTSWLGPPDDAPDGLRFVVDDVFDIAARGGLLVTGRLAGGTVRKGTTLRADDGRTVRVIGVEFATPRQQGTDRMTLLVDRTDADAVRPGIILTSYS